MSKVIIIIYLFILKKKTLSKKVNVKRDIISHSTPFVQVIHNDMFGSYPK